jgi:hypothetical protein
MKITIRQSGGFAGTSIELAVVDVDTRNPARAAALRSAVDASGFFALPATVGGGQVGADFAAYEITVEDGARRHTVKLVDDGSPQTAALRALRDAVLGSR